MTEHTPCGIVFVISFIFHVVCNRQTYIYKKIIIIALFRACVFS